MNGGFNFDTEPPKTKSTPKLVDNGWFYAITKDRDRLFYAEAKQRGDTEMMEYLIKKHGKTN